MPVLCGTAVTRECRRGTVASQSLNDATRADPDVERERSPDLATALRSQSAASTTHGGRIDSVPCLRPGDLRWASYAEDGVNLDDLACPRGLEVVRDRLRLPTAELVAGDPSTVGEGTECQRRRTTSTRARNAASTSCPTRQSERGSASAEGFAGSADAPNDVNQSRLKVVEVETGLHGCAMISREGGHSARLGAVWRSHRATRRLSARRASMNQLVNATRPADRGPEV